MKKKNIKTGKIILTILAVGFLIFARQYVFALFQLGSQWESINITLENPRVDLGETPRLILDYLPTNRTMNECPSNYYAYSTASVFVDNKLHKIQTHKISCLSPTTIKVSLPNNLLQGEHNVSVNVGVMRFLGEKRLERFTLGGCYEGVSWEGRLMYEPEDYLFENIFKQDKLCEFFDKIKVIEGLTYTCADVSGRISSCHCGGIIGPTDTKGCPTYACYNRIGGDGPCVSGWLTGDWESYYKKCIYEYKYSSSTCVSRLKKYGYVSSEPASWGEIGATLPVSSITNYIYDEQSDFDYYPYIDYEFEAETIEKLFVGIIPEEEIPEEEIEVPPEEEVIPTEEIVPEEEIEIVPPGVPTIEVVWYEKIWQSITQFFESIFG